LVGGQRRFRCPGFRKRPKAKPSRDHGIVRNEKAEEQPKDKQRAQTAHNTDAKDSVSKEETRK
jgi:hypothetical protein